jgi:high-affinity Fe2+/Pb2+ permease
VKKPFTAVTVAVLALIAALQLARFILSWPVTVNELSIPVWASGIACLVAAGLAAMVWREMRS